MARIVGGVAVSHTPTIGFAVDTRKQDDPAWPTTVVPLQVGVLQFPIPTLVDPEDPSLKESYLAPGYSIDAAAVSPSGEWLAYVSNQTGVREVYEGPFPGPGREQLVSVDGGDFPAWGGTDEVLAYTSRSGETLIRASLRFEPLRVTERRQLFTSNDYWTSIRRADYDVRSSDGRLLMTHAVDGVCAARGLLALNG
jgi:hypothetical protein